MSQHTAKINWQRNEAIFSDAKYSRGHLISFDGGVSIMGSSAPDVVRPPLSVVEAADPEELTVAAVASCHMLFFLDFARRAGLIVENYEDNPIGKLGKNENGKIAFVEITLRPIIDFAGENPNSGILQELHDKSHEACFIANSLSCHIKIEV